MSTCARAKVGEGGKNAGDFLALPGEMEESAPANFGFLSQTITSEESNAPKEQQYR